jgi:hypothetical protein
MQAYISRTVRETCHIFEQSDQTISAGDNSIRVSTSHKIGSTTVRGTGYSIFRHVVIINLSNIRFQMCREMSVMETIPQSDGKYDDC